MPQPQVRNKQVGQAGMGVLAGPTAVFGLQCSLPASLQCQHMDATPPCCSNGGSIGWIGKGQTVPEFEAAAFGTAPGGLAVCTTRFGVHLLQVLGER